MKIAYITNVRMPTEKAHGIQMARMCEAFANNGASVDFYVPWRFNSIKSDPFEYYGLKKNFKIHKIFSVDLIGIVPFLGYWIQILSFIFCASLRFLFVSRKKTLIYTREYILVFVFKLLGFRVIYECHRIIANKNLFFSFVKRADKIITNSAGVAEEFKNRGFDNVLACQNGVDLAEFSFDTSKNELRKMKNLPLDKKIVMYTGYLYKWKGIETVFKTIEILSKDSRLIFVLVGGSEEDVKYYKNFAEKKALTNVMLLGHKNRKEIPYYLKSADVFLLPNSPISEESIKYTSPVKLAEYMASKNPIIASDLPSIRVVLNEGNSLLIPPDNAQIMADAIKKIISDTEQSKQLTDKAFSDVQEYTWDKRAKKIIEFISDVV